MKVPSFNPFYPVTKEMVKRWGGKVRARVMGIKKPDPPPLPPSKKTASSNIEYKSPSAQLCPTCRSNKTYKVPDKPYYVCEVCSQAWT